jgi:hypothetical protein
VDIPGIPLLDLRLICDAETDDAHPMEPSVASGVKIGGVMARVVREYEFGRGWTEVYIEYHL